MAVTATIYTSAYLSLANKEIDWDTDNIYAALVTSAYTPNRNTHRYWSDVSAYESSGTGYTAGGLLLTNKTNVLNSGSNSVLFGADDLQWTTTTISDARYCVFCSNNGSSPLISYIDFGSVQSTVAQPFAISLVNGIFKLTAS